MNPVLLHFDRPSRRIVLLACCFGLMLCGAGRASRLLPLSGAPGTVHEVFGVGDGLPVAGITQALQTRDGYLWLATFDGLVRFDGIHFEVFDSERAPALGSNRIVDLAEDRGGSLWILSEQGHLVRYGNGTFTACGAPAAGRATCALRQAGPPLFTILTADPAGSLWTGGSSGLFEILESELWQVPGLRPEAPIRSLFWDRTDRIWVGTPRDLWRGQRGRFERVALPSGSFDVLIPTVAEDDEGGIWVATFQGAGRMRGGTWSPEIAGPGFVAQGPDEGLWISVQDSIHEPSGNRLLRYRSGQLETFATGPVGDYRLLPGRSFCRGPGGAVWTAWTRAVYRDKVEVFRLPGQINITSLLADREGTVWLTTSAAGELHALHPAQLAAFGAAAGLPSPNVYPVYEDRDGTIWTGGDDFLASLAPGAGRFEVQPGPAGPLQRVTAFLRDQAGTLWVGTTKGLFIRKETDRFPRWTGPEALQTAEIRALFEDSHGALWVGTSTGLFRREAPGRGEAGSERWSRFTARDGLPHPWVRVIRETPDGALWLGTNGGGVIRFAGGRFTAVTQAQGLSSDLVRAIWPAPDGRLWIGTENRGLNRLDPATVGRAGKPRIDVVGQRKGLFANGIHQIVADGLGNLWMSSNSGIFRVGLDDLNRVAGGEKPRLDCMAFTERDGMIAREANGGVQDAGLRDRAGRIWFPTQGGLVRADPRRLLRPQEPPPVHVEGVQVGETEAPVQNGALRLEPPQRSFTLALAAPTFLAPERQRLRFRLTPYDRDWIEAGARREAVYTRVPPGKYRFEVVAASPDGTWGRRPAAVAVEVVPRFYETWWFLLACGLAIAAAIGAAIRWWGVRSRARQEELELLVEDRTHTIALQAKELRELDRLRSEFFANVSHELRTPLTLILGPLQDARAGHFGLLGEDLAAQLRVAERNAQNLLGLVDQLLDVARLDAGGLRLNLRREDLAGLVRRSVESFLPLAGRRGIDLALSVPAEPVEIWCDEVQLEKVFGNLLSNALKFTPERGKVRVAVTAPAGTDRVQVTVQDTGPGIPTDQLERVFERFYQVPATDQRRGTGAGIGLALARQLAELHGGKITAESVTGPKGHEGSRFLVTLRRAEAGPKSPTPLPFRRPIIQPVEAPSTPPLQGPAPGPEEDRTTVLVVDDNADIRAYVRRHLEPAYRVVEAADGIEGLEQARRLQPDLVVSDVMMPGLDGNALFRSLREDPELALTPVVLLTAKASTESRLEGLREGVDDYLIKPFDPRELKARLDNLVASRRRLLERFEAAPPSKPLRALQASKIEVTPADESFLSRVQATIESRLDDPTLTVEALAEALGCDRSYLLRKLRALTGETPSDLIRSLRLQRAEQLLRAGAGAVSEIAYSVGFKSVAHFSNAFHDRYGERPSVFAARHRAG